MDQEAFNWRKIASLRRQRIEMWDGARFITKGLYRINSVVDRFKPRVSTAFLASTHSDHLWALLMVRMPSSVLPPGGSNLEAALVEGAELTKPLPVQRNQHPS